MNRLKFLWKDGIFRRRSGWRRLIVILFTLALTTSIQLNYAIGPTLPIAFDDDDQRDSLTVVLRIDPAQVQVVRIARQIYLDGKQISVEPIEPNIEKRDRINRAAFSLRFKDVERLRPGAYAQKIVVEGKWLNQNASKSLYIQRWFYFTVRDGDVRRIDMEEYSNQVDPVDTDVDSRGQRAPVYRGLDLKAAVPLTRTKRSFAVPIDPRGGATEENAPRDKRYKQEVDRSEVNQK